MKHYAVNYLKSDSSRTPQTIFVKAKNDEEAVDKAYDLVGGFYHGDTDLITAKRAKQIAVRFNPPFYAHNLYEKKTHGLNYKQMRRLYAMVSRGNQKAITYARNVLGIPFSESPTQVKAVVYHHVRDLAERRVRRNPFRSGGYLRETPKEAGYKVISLKGRQLILEDLADGKRELWARSPNFAGYAIFYKNNTYEFVTSVLPGMTPVLPRAGQPIKGNPARSHRERIAIDTVRHPMKGYFLGGPDLAESVRYLRSLGYSMAQLKKLNPEVEDILEGRKSILPNRRKGPVTEREIRAMYRRHGVGLSQRGMFGKGYDAVSEYGYVMGRGPYKTAKEAERYVIKFYKKRPRLVRQ